MDEDERVSVATYLPRYQKELWAEHAEDLGMSQSEFVRTMVQAGRTDFDVPTTGAEADPTTDGDASTEADAFEPRVLAALKRNGALDWDDLVSALVDNVESDLENALEELQSDNAIRYSGREGGYVLVDDE